MQGDQLGSLLEQEGIECQPVRLDNTTRENVIVHEESSGETFHFIMPGSEIKESGWQQYLEVFESLDPFPAYVVGSGSLAPGVPDDFYARVADITADHHSRFVIRTSGTCLCLALERGVYLVKFSSDSLREYAGKELPEEGDQEEVAMQIVDQGQSEVVVVSLANAGAFVATHTGVDYIRAPGVEAKSDVGAGNSMVAGIVFQLAQDATVLDAVKYGIAAATATVAEAGMELCCLEKTEHLYRQIISEGQKFGIPDMSNVGNIRR
jgi:6-phosphofructokinase 2